MSEAKKIRIGIDVGGTFTHAVAVEADTFEIIEKAKVPTTHRAPEGVAKGIVDALQTILSRVDKSEIIFIAYSTTQATNALLEGDVAMVGILGMGRGKMAARGTRIGSVELAPGRFLRTCHRFLDTSKNPLDERTIEQEIKVLIGMGAEALVFSEAFGVDDPSNEQMALAVAKRMNLHATAGSDISRLYGLRARTRTAVINASMLPKMLESAEMTERSVLEAGIHAPLMVMRSDGGVMDLAEMRRRPILTMLSGPAAGVAAALMYLKISDGIFLEVGGTSTDISAIKNGKAAVQSAEIGGHRIYLRTLDVRTLGVAGGSVPRLKNGRVIEVGPRSAHIAGLDYASFPKSELSGSPFIQMIQPLDRDPKDYLAIGDGEERSFTLTPTCAANRLGLVPAGDPASGNADFLEQAFAFAEDRLKSQHFARQILEKAVVQPANVVKRLVEESKLDPQVLTLVGGGGGAAAIVPFLAESTGRNFRLSQNSDVLSAIGVALAMVRDSVERTVTNPSNEDILKIRREAEQAVMRMGADSKTIEVQVEVDPKKSLLRATATGATEMKTSKDSHRSEASLDECRKVAEQSLGAPVELLEETNFFRAFGYTTPKKLFASLRTRIRIVDLEGVIRLQTNHGVARSVTASEAPREIEKLAEEHASYGDGGKSIPDLFVLHGSKILDLTGLLNTEQVLSLARIELEGMEPAEKILLLAHLR